jgi:hypothetical protein
MKCATRTTGAKDLMLFSLTGSFRMWSIREVAGKQEQLTAIDTSRRRPRRRRSLSRPATKHQHRPHFHRPTHNRPGRQRSTVTASREISADDSSRTQSSFRKARRNDTGPS